MNLPEAGCKSPLKVAKDELIVHCWHIWCHCIKKNIPVLANNKRKWTWNSLLQPTQHQIVDTKSASASKIARLFIHDLRALKVKLHHTVIWGRAHCYTLIPPPSVRVDTESPHFMQNLLSKEFAVPPCHSLWHANSTCTYLNSVTSIFPYFDLRCPRLPKSKQTFTSYIITWLISNIFDWKFLGVF